MVATKGNLIAAQTTLRLCQTGCELLDKKRNILSGELMSLTDAANKLQSEMLEVFGNAYSALERANIDVGIDTVEKIGLAMQVENSLKIKIKSVMGVEIPVVLIEDKPLRPEYGMKNTTSSLDEAVSCFAKAKRMACLLAQTEASVKRLEASIRKTQKRANALKNILIPRYEEEIKNIGVILDEKEREEFVRLKITKRQKNKAGD